MKRLLSLAAAAIIACGYTQAQTDYTVKLNDDQVKALRNKIINEYEDQRANTMDWARFSRYAKDAKKIRYRNRAGAERSLPELMEMDVNTAWEFCRDMSTVSQRLETLRDLGLGYLTLGEETPGLSGGEAQRLKLASEMGRQQEDSVFVFDEPTIGLHPKDVETLLQVFRTLIDHGATVIVIEHDLDVIRSADYVIDMGPEGGEDGGRVVACGTPEEIRACRDSITGRFI